MFEFLLRLSNLVPRKARRVGLMMVFWVLSGFYLSDAQGRMEQMPSVSQASSVSQTPHVSQAHTVPLQSAQKVNAHTEENPQDIQSYLERSPLLPAPATSTDRHQSQPDSSKSTFLESLRLYEEGDYENAAASFKMLDSDEASLFLGKSYYALGRLLPAEHALKPLLESEDAVLRKEAHYTMALIRFGMRDYTGSLERLAALQEEPRRTAILVDAARLYQQILRFLTPADRFTVFHQTTSNSLKADLLIQGTSYLSNPEYQVLEAAFLSQFQDSTEVQFWENYLHKNTNHRAEATPVYPAAPKGMVYRIGVLLPEFAPDDPRYTIPRNLYHGLTFAAEQYNASGGSKKVQLHFLPSSDDPDSLRKSFLGLVYTNHVDAVFGPLFSGPAGVISLLAEEHKIPLLLPLANNDQINTDHNYTFQMNPVFDVHGKQMARFAVQTLGLDSLAVISQKGSFGEAAANAFRVEAEELGAVIQYQYKEDFRSFGFDLSEFTASFTTDSVLVDSLGYRPVNAVYAPFTGQEAGTLSRLLANDVELHNKKITILGLEEWKNTNLTPWQVNQLEIWYSEPFRPTSDTTEVSSGETLTTELSQRFSMEPDLFTFIGFDAGSYLLESLEIAGNPSLLKTVLKDRQPYEGTAMRVDFDGFRSNQHIYVSPLTDPALLKMREMRDPEAMEGSNGLHQSEDMEQESP